MRIVHHLLRENPLLLEIRSYGVIIFSECAAREFGIEALEKVVALVGAYLIGVVNQPFRKALNILKLEL